nr:hypothetical protein [Bauldia sp.]
MSTPTFVQEFLVTNGNSEADARVAALANGDIAVVYSTGMGEVRAAIFGPGGEPIDDVLLSGDAGLLPDASIAALPDGGFVVAIAVAPLGVLAAFVASSLDSFSPVLAFVGEATDPRVTVLDNGNVVVTFASDGNIGFQVLTPDGPPVGPIGAIEGGAVYAKPEIAALAGGGFVVAGISDDNNGDPIFAIFDESGTPGGDGWASDGGVVEDDAFVFGLAGGGFVVAFTNESGSDGSGDGIFFTVHDASGNQPAPYAHFANTGASGNQHDATGVGLRDG